MVNCIWLTKKITSKINESFWAMIKSLGLQFLAEMTKSMHIITHENLFLFIFYEFVILSKIITLNLYDRKL